ncbi:hypothetical protein P3X46_015084 [Hevea brasiliensis]|uniref:Cellulose synthase-like protein D5 n=1 Tax=Hevea brasiliensis TaxID=3981 RepID=A0ABQ9LUS7_HEVBR|nr:hypothetical protein P3X46_015084 [Hevea brasiliensis]
MVKTANSPSSSSVTIMVSSGGKGGGSRSMGLTSSNRTSSGGRFCSMSKDDTSEEMSSEFVTYTVHIPPTPDHQPMSVSQTSLCEDINNAAKPERLYISGTIFTGGLNSVTRGHVIDRLIEVTKSLKSGLVCGVKGCDDKAVQGLCECGFKICRDCYLDCVGSNGVGHCPGCKEPYKDVDDEELDEDDEAKSEEEDQALPLPKLDKRLSLVKSTKALNHPPDFDHTRWLFETKGTYGYRNAVWPKDGYGAGSGANGFEHPPDFEERSRRPLTRKVGVSAAILSPYILLIAIRLAALCMFLTWRIRHPNREAMWLWGMSITLLPKLCPVNRVTGLFVLKDRFESPNLRNPKGRSDLPGIDVFVSTVDPDKEPPFVTANTILSILAVDYPEEKLACYLSDDGGSLLTFEALAETASLARIWVPFCKKHNIEPRNPEAYFGQKRDFLKNKVRLDFVRERRRVKRKYDEFKVRINSLRRSDAYNAHEELRAKKKQMEMGGNPSELIKVPKAAWMSDGSHWPGTWASGESDHSRGDHAMLAPPNAEPVYGAEADGENMIGTTEVDIRLPMLVYVSREKRLGYDHNKKAGAMNALVRTSAIMSNGPFILNLDCDHYIYNSLALREGMCFMLHRGGDRNCYVQFPQRFEGIDPSDRYANQNTVFFDVSMRALDGLQGPMYVGTGCIFRRTALYGFSPPRTTEHHGWFGRKKIKLFLRKPKTTKKQEDEIALPINGEHNDDDADIESLLLPKRFGTTEHHGWFGRKKIKLFLRKPKTTKKQEDEIALPINGEHHDDDADIESLLLPKGFGNSTSLAVLLGSLWMPQLLQKAISVISCFYEDKTEWGKRVGWIYGSVTEDVLWATGSVEIFFSRNNALFASPMMKFLLRVAYFNVGMYPFTSMFLIVYCVLATVSLFSGQFIVQSLSVTFLVFLLAITITLCMLALLEIKWSGITLHDWWRNEQFWLIGGTSAHPAAVLQGLLKVIAGVDISFTLTSKSAASDEGDDEFAELYVVKWSFLMVPPITIMILNIIAIAVGVARTMCKWVQYLSTVEQAVWRGVLQLLGFVPSLPICKRLDGKKGEGTNHCLCVVWFALHHFIVYVWSGLLSIIIS